MYRNVQKCVIFGLMDLILKIPVHGRVRKYIEYYHPESPIKVSNHSPIGSLLLSVLVRNQNPEPHKYERNYSDIIKFSVSQRWQESRGKDLSNFSLFVFNNTVDQIMREQLYTSLYMFRVMGKPVVEKETIITFLRLHGISEDEMPYETIRRDWNRFLKNKASKSKIFASTLSPNVCPEHYSKKLGYR